jgi:predicted SAM-dependent methyltransferase
MDQPARSVPPAATRKLRSAMRKAWLGASLLSNRAFGLRPPAGDLGLAQDEAIRNRVVLASRFLRGDGIEIGAANRPLPMPGGARVTYVDRKGLDGLYAEYGSVLRFGIVAPSVVDDAQTLGCFADASLDFVVACHVVEHLEDPLAFFRSCARVLRAGGVVFCAVPERELTFDRRRALTPFGHLLADHRDGPEASRAAHFRDYVRLADIQDGARAWTDEAGYERQVAKLMEEDASIHYHVWNRETFLDLALRLRSELDLPFRIEASLCHVDEVLVVLRKDAP